ncbi:MAG: flagellar export chaperone FliS [Candidatus Solibacter sp.]|nr:flagellar export chaperone FliS [Candidatus Solibacter sp.]
MSYVNPYAETLEQEVYAADPARLVLMLLRGARQSVEEAREALHGGDVRRRALAVSRAVERIGELSASLDGERGGAMAGRLGRLYEYMVHRLNEANGRQEEAGLEEVSRLLLPLIEAWGEVAVQWMEVRAPGSGESEVRACA